MFLKLFSLFLIIPVVEIYLLLKVGEIIGALNTVLIILITAGIGAYLTKSQGFRVLRQIQDATMQGYMPGNELLHGLFVLIGGLCPSDPPWLPDRYHRVFHAYSSDPGDLCENSKRDHKEKDTAGQHPDEDVY